MGERTVQEFKQTANQIVGFYKECQQARERAFVLGKQAAAVELLQLCEAMRQKERKYVNTDILLGHTFVKQTRDKEFAREAICRLQRSA